MSATSGDIVDRAVDGEVDREVGIGAIVGEEFGVSELFGALL